MDRLEIATEKIFRENYKEKHSEDARKGLEAGKERCGLRFWTKKERKWLLGREHRAVLS